MPCHPDDWNLITLEGTWRFCLVLGVGGLALSVLLPTFGATRCTFPEFKVAGKRPKLERNSGISSDQCALHLGAGSTGFQSKCNLHSCNNCGCATYALCPWCSAVGS